MEKTNKITQYSLLLVVLLIMSISDSNASEKNPVTEEDKMFIMFLQRAVAGHRVEQIAAHILYPLRINSGHSTNVNTPRTEYIKTKEEFISRYNEVFTDKIEAAIKQQNPDTLFKNYKGIMIGHGEVWIHDLVILPDNNPKHHELYIVTINLN